MDSQEINQLRTLAVFHFVWAGLTLSLGIVAVIIYFAFGVGMIAGFAMFTFENQMVLGIVGVVFIVVSIMASLAVGISAVLNLLTGIFLLKRKHRVFCIVTDAINCMNMPLGTALGISGIVILLNPDVKVLFN